ncbi:AAA+-type ATPase [Recurvomyces mirabilis]|uniref:AAA+-type ATPase n=1 Tax=Recurvomyces mirabilis TaxID=574656 RepID=A0AAE1BYZ2_9PEZI|nr:AAA+-type ATPase [Recurvomyces mirabilis]KAK5150864.1 AAA+-type ATPase [Recurvomyces mirabilis]
MNPPNGRLSIHMANDPTSFVIRPLPGAGLDGAFRFHLSPDSLDRLGLQSGVDVCQITGEKGGTGYGIAWRATDKMGTSPKLRPVKLTSTAQAAFGFQEGSHVAISKSAASIMPAASLTLTDITPPDWRTPDDTDDLAWLKRADSYLTDCEAIAAGTTFDLSAKKKLRRRFYVDHVQGNSASGTSGLFYCDGMTKVVIGDESTRFDTPSLALGDSFPVLDIGAIGGLVDEIKLLNKRMDRVLNRSSHVVSKSRHAHDARHTLLHGYEGTGKSMLIEAVERTPGASIHTIREDDLSTPTKAITFIEQTFDDALRAQPSIITIDKLDKLMPKENSTLTSVLVRQFKKIRGARVFVLAAARSTLSIDNVLLRAARTAILRTMLVDESEGLAELISSKTHGFTGGDLDMLVSRAHEFAEDRVDFHLSGILPIGLRDELRNGNATNGNGHMASSIYSEDTTQVDTSLLEMQPPALTEEDFDLARATVHPSALREVFFEKPKVKWSNIGGSDAIKQQFDDTLGLPLQHPEQFARYDLRPSKGVLLYGPPGCSKTMTAQAVATTYNLNFIAIKGAELISMYVGESEKAIRELFGKARQAAPCVIFFDEIDAIGAERDAGGTKGLNVLTTLLNEMDGFEETKNVLVLAATNKPEVLDPALLRPGRFDSHIYIGLPNIEARKEILKIGLRVAEGVDIEKLAADTEGYSGAEIVRICNMAKMSGFKHDVATESSRIAIGGQDFEEAFRAVRKGTTAEMLEGYEAFATR